MIDLGFGLLLKRTRNRKEKTIARLQLALACLAMLSWFGLACQPADESAGPSRVDNAEGRVLAIVDGKPISESTVDSALRIEHYDLEYAKYRSRRDRLESLISDRLGKDIIRGSREWNDRVRIELAMPPPPRFEIPEGQGPGRGSTVAPISVVEFLDFESPHSRRLQPDLMRILDRYGERVRLRIRDFPLPYHRYARQAAAAARCAGEQDAYWIYHDILLLERPQLAALERNVYAERLGLDSDLIEVCIESGRHAPMIDADVELASRLGVSRAATIFVNGLYLSGHPSFEEIDDVVRRELLRLGLDSNPSARTRGQATARAPNTLSPEQLRAQNKRRAELPAIPRGEISQPEAIVSLTRAEVEFALEDRDGLERKLGASRGEFSGQRMLTVRDVSEGDFYSRLGLIDRDVLMIVNGEFVTAEHNWIWDAFATSDRITLLFMRRGRPHSIEYQIR